MNLPPVSLNRSPPTALRTALIYFVNHKLKKKKKNFFFFVIMGTIWKKFEKNKTTILYTVMWNLINLINVITDDTGYD